MGMPSRRRFERWYARQYKTGAGWGVEDAQWTRIAHAAQAALSTLPRRLWASESPPEAIADGIDFQLDRKVGSRELLPGDRSLVKALMAFSDRRYRAVQRARRSERRGRPRFAPTVGWHWYLLRLVPIVLGFGVVMSWAILLGDGVMSTWWTRATHTLDGRAVATVQSQMMHRRHRSNPNRLKIAYRFRTRNGVPVERTQWVARWRGAEHTAALRRRYAVGAKLAVRYDRSSPSHALVEPTWLDYTSQFATLAVVMFGVLVLFLFGVRR